MSGFKIDVISNDFNLDYTARLTTRSGQTFYGNGNTEKEARDAAATAFASAVRGVEKPKPKVKGYRELSAADIELMNEIKAKGEEVGELVSKLQGLDGMDQRAIAIGKTELQTGLMWLVRGVAQPDSF